MNEPMPIENTRETVEALLSVLQNLVQELHPGRPMAAISLDSSLDKDLGLDSLGRVELMHRIERRFDLAPPERLFAEAETPRDLLCAMLQASTATSQPGSMEFANLAVGGGQPAPHDAETLVGVLDWHVCQHPDRPHIRFYSDDDEGMTLTYRQLQTESAKVASGLQAAGLRQGQAVAIMLPTGPDYFFSFIGVLLAGGVPVPMYPPPRMSQLEEQLRRYVAILSNCASPLMITMPEGKQHAKLLCSLVGSLAQVVSVEELSKVGGGCATPGIGSGDTAFLQYTSGSTGTPKGVVLTHANLLANVRAMGMAVGVRPDDVFVSWLPLYHDMGLIGAWLGSLYHAMPLVVMPPLSFISKPQRWLNAIHRYRGTLSASPNFGYEICLRRLEEQDTAGLDLSCWRAAFNGAEAVMPETIERFIERFKPNGFRPDAMMPVYGLAESSVGLGFPPLGRGPLIDRIQRESFSRRGTAMPAEADAPSALRFVACGMPLPGHQIRVVDDAGRELPERRQGRIEFRGPSSTSGYFRNSEHTRALFHGDWLVTGDLGYISGGEIFVTGRKKDIIIRAGRNIHPQEVEQAVSDIEGIRNDCVAVFGGVNAATGTERLIVLAETRRSDEVQAEALRAQVNAVVTGLIGEPPDDIVLAPPGAVLKTSSGKVRRAAIRELYERGEVGKSRHSSWPPLAGWFMEGLQTNFRRSLIKAGEWLFAAYAWSLFALLAPVVWTSAMALPTPNQRWNAMRIGIRWLQMATGTPILVGGLDELPPEGQAFVLVANHSSYLDVYALTAALPRRLSFVAKAELARNKLLGPALRGIGTEFVERFDAEKGVNDARHLAGTLRQGNPLAFFPEGTFTRRPGLMPFHLGAFAAAIEADVPVIPVALHGTRSMLRDGSWFPRRGIVNVTIGKPISPALILGENGGDHWKATINLRDLTREHILRHVGEPDLGKS
ncbi:MAG: AMP-binding protein [Proteobacteria bacterium]|nr:AMP-binding protein [Pseudomonadota bacterium]